MCLCTQYTACSYVVCVDKSAAMYQQINNKNLNITRQESSGGRDDFIFGEGNTFFKQKVIEIYVIK